jgi:cellulose biosynthesis protein BcsQ
MKSIAIFNNKGGVGKTTLTYHVACALAEMGHKTLLIDLDPQSNLTLYGLSEEDLHDIWEKEETFIDDFDTSRKNMSPNEFKELVKGPRSIHFILKPTEEGTGDIDQLPNPVNVRRNLGLIPGRLTIHTYEDKIASRWSDTFMGEPLALRTISRIRKVCNDYASQGYEIILIDTSPSLGILNKVIISTADGFVIPCMPDMFSLYGIRNIGKSLKKWKREFDMMRQLLSDQKREFLSAELVRFLGFTIFNARKYTSRKNEWDLAQAHYNYAQKIPQTITDFLPKETYEHIPSELRDKPIGGTAVMHSHSTLPAMAQKYRCPIWEVPDQNLDAEDKPTISGNQSQYRATKEKYHLFATELLERMTFLD